MRVALFPLCESINYNYINFWLRELFVLPAYNYNYINDSSANHLCNSFVDHGRHILQRLHLLRAISCKFALIIRRS